MSGRMRYTQRELRHAIIADTITDIRCAGRDGMPEYAAKCRAQLRLLLKNRHMDAGIDRFGWPKELMAVQS